MSENRRAVLGYYAEPRVRIFLTDVCLRAWHVRSMRTVLLLFVANIFMTFAWYGHLGRLRDKPLWIAILVSWGIAFFEYCLQVPANRIGYGAFSLGQLKVTQEVITMVVFMGFSALYMKKPITMDLVWATLCLALAAYFMFRGGTSAGSDA